MPVIMSLLYPRTETSTFDMNYYLTKHMPLAAKYWYPHGLLKWEVQEIPAGKYSVKSDCYFESMDAFQTAVSQKEELKEIMGDVKNYSNEQPDQLVGEVVGGGEKPKL
jgi:uncharacterized protein (TIGR02118 family)